ncbi:hypothetical protein [Bacillus solimangrovi]|uniref:Uncharacterized protein n=1 Tax=Bacillus solimangrovi TaxID=1305675 RepID=A0A1E5LD86_9BACI|nr:hypothetical protein [Bacillus solimangrovi]OEH91999.1 hypothetical protein BFG57_17190 [Bacillus solimangrovi]
MDSKKLKRIKIEEIVIFNVFSIFVFCLLYFSFRLFSFISVVYVTIDLIVLHYKQRTLFEIFFPNLKVLKDMRNNKLGDEQVKKDIKNQKRFLLVVIVSMLISSVFINDFKFEFVELFRSFIPVIIILNIFSVRDYRKMATLTDEEFRELRKTDLKFSSFLRIFLILFVLFFLFNFVFLMLII